MFTTYETAGTFNMNIQQEIERKIEDVVALSRQLKDDRARYKSDRLPASYNVYSETFANLRVSVEYIRMLHGEEGFKP